MPHATPEQVANALATVRAIQKAKSQGLPYSRASATSSLSPSPSTSPPSPPRNKPTATKGTSRRAQPTTSPYHSSPNSPASTKTSSPAPRLATKRRTPPSSSAATNPRPAPPPQAPFDMHAVRLPARRPAGAPKPPPSWAAFKRGVRRAAAARTRATEQHLARQEIGGVDGRVAEEEEKAVDAEGGREKKRTRVVPSREVGEGWMRW